LRGKIATNIKTYTWSRGRDQLLWIQDGARPWSKRRSEFGAVFPFIFVFSSSLELNS
jgi:hypothetical protein